MTRRLGFLLFFLLLWQPSADAQRISPSGGGGPIATQSCTTTNAIPRLSTASTSVAVLDCTPLTSDGTNVTLGSGVLLAPNGAAGAPPYSFTSAPTTGLYTDGATLNIAVSGAQRALFGTAGFQLAQTGKLYYGLSAPDISLARAGAAGSFAFSDEANGKALNVKMLTELTTIAAAATTDTTIQIPANSLVIAVTVRVTTVIPTATTFDIGVAGATNRYGDDLSTAATTTHSSPGTTNPTIYASAVSLRFTPNLTPINDSGRVRTTIYYIDATAPTSFLLPEDSFMRKAA